MGEGIPARFRGELEGILEERKGWLRWRNLASKVELLEGLPPVERRRLQIGPVPTVEVEGVPDRKILEVARELKPWRKGPFKINSLFIDSEWRSDLKWEIVGPEIEGAGKEVVDVGCNNGYYLFRLWEQGPKYLAGWDPTPLFYLQFQFLNHFFQLPIDYFPLGVEQLPLTPNRWDLILCMGVLYHRPDPIRMLKELRQGLRPGGELILDTLIIPGEEEVALTPRRYGKMKNVYFIPTLPALFNWLDRAKFSRWRVIGIRRTTLEEQRKTDWIDGESLESFLTPDQSRTIEGYPPPTRAYLKVWK